MQITEEFKIRLEKAMTHREKKPIDIVKATGISQSALSQYRSGATKPNRNNLLKLAEYLNVNPVWLMGLDVPMEIPSKPSIDAKTLIEHQFPDIDEETLKRLKLAVEFYDKYKNAIPAIQKAVDGLLDTPQSDE